MVTQVIAIVGRAGSGKDVVAKCFAEVYGVSRSYSPTYEAIKTAIDKSADNEQVNLACTYITDPKGLKELDKNLANTNIAIREIRVDSRSDIRMERLEKRGDRLTDVLLRMKSEDKMYEKYERESDKDMGVAVVKNVHTIEDLYERISHVANNMGLSVGKWK